MTRLEINVSEKTPGLLTRSRPGLTEGRSQRFSSAAIPFDVTGSATCLAAI
jgi:hypothetical protein